MSEPNYEFCPRARILGADSHLRTTRSACVIARRKWVLIRPKAEHFARYRRAVCQARCACVIARPWRILIRPKAERFARHRRAVYPGVKRLFYCPPQAGLKSADGRTFCSPKASSLPGREAASRLSSEGREVIARLLLGPRTSTGSSPPAAAACTYIYKTKLSSLARQYRRKYTCACR